jgi:two-component system, LytTR family, response regulator
MNFRALIVDDEPLAVEGLRLLLRQDSDIAAIDEASGGAEAVAAIRSATPDIVFLDVQMPEMDGFDVVNTVGVENMPSVVFATAHDHHALRAFEANAVDYLLKPIQRDRFFAALKRAKARVRVDRDDSERRIVSLLQSMERSKRRLRRIAVKSAGRTTFVSVDDIDWIGAADNYVELHCGGDSSLVRCSMAEIESALDPDDFVRIHRSAIVNVNRVKEVRAGSAGEYTIVMHRGERLESSRGFADNVRTLIRNSF